MSRGLLSAWPGVFYLREDQGGHRAGEDDFASLDGASFRMDSQDQQEGEGVWLEGKERASSVMELQGKKEAEAGVVSGEVLVVSTAWPSGRNYLSSWSGQMS